MPSGSLPSPIGIILVEANADRLTSLRIVQDMPRTLSSGSALIDDALAQLRAWLAHGSHRFDLPLAPAATPRGQALRDAIGGIPAGDVISYGRLASLAASSARAIGQACARNPFPIIVPCHRVIQAGGRLGAYSAGQGIATKAWMLRHEQGDLFGA